MDYATAYKLLSPPGQLALDKGWVTTEQAVAMGDAHLELLISPNGLKALENKYVDADKLAQTEVAMVRRLLTDDSLDGMERGAFTWGDLVKVDKREPDRRLRYKLL